MENFEKLRLACQKYGKTELARRLGITTQGIYKALERNTGLRPVYMLEIDKLLADTITTQGTTQEQLSPSSSPLSQLERLILDNVHKLTEQAQAEVLAVILDILKNPNNLTPK